MCTCIDFNLYATVLFKTPHFFESSNLYLLSYVLISIVKFYVKGCLLHHTAHYQPKFLLHRNLFMSIVVYQTALSLTIVKPCCSKLVNDVGSAVVPMGFVVYWDHTEISDMIWWSFRRLQNSSYSGSWMNSDRVTFGNERTDYVLCHANCNVRINFLEYSSAKNDQAFRIRLAPKVQVSTIEASAFLINNLWMQNVVDELQYTCCEMVIKSGN